MPLAPGYKIQKETLAVHFVPGSPPHLAIRAQYRLANVGNAPLHFIGVELPGEKNFGRANLRAEVDGKEITLQHNPHEAADDWRIPLPAAWRQKEKLNLVLSYDLAAQSATDPRIFAAANAFYLNDSGWLPALMGFKAFLSPAIVRPNPTDLAVTVPADFRITASGQLRGVKKQNGETEYRFRIRKGGFDPYILAGQYSQHRISAAGIDVVIWTFQPMPAAQAQQTAASIAAAARFYVRTFGPLPKNMGTFTVADIKTSSASPFADILPGIVFNWVLPDQSASRLGSPPIPQVPELDVAYTWFGHLITPRAEAWMLAEAMSAYALSLNSAPKYDKAERSEAIQGLLQNYDRHTSKSVEKPIPILLPSDPSEQVSIGRVRAELFLLALEDKCGQQNLTHAISDMVYALRGQEYGYSDFRAALEQQCHQDLDSFFRTWLAQPGIPPDFRARYENAGAGKQ